VAVAIRSEFFGLSPIDPVSFLAAGGILLIVVLVASFAPAWRAAALDPMAALRKE
jgi:ABC-type lipoprotein release transport system permease subunit